MADTHEERLKRAFISLEGLSVGDAFDGFYELNSALRDRLNARILFKSPWHYTDDTNMALSIVEGIPKAWRQSREPLPEWVFADES